MKPAIRIGLLATLLVAVAVVYPRYHRERGLRREYNAIVIELVDAGKYEEAIARLEQMPSSGSVELSAAVRNSLATCYRNLAHAETSTPEETVQRLKEAQRLDPSVLTEDDQAFLEEAHAAGGDPETPER